MSTETFDLVIIGGGINGAGIARDAVSRGMKVALVEANDFAYGTSSRSSKLIHGGVRYLENLEFHLVFEALSERKILFEIAPHLVHPLKFVLPVYKSSRFGMSILSLGMWLYDLLSLFDAPESHERLNREDAEERLPFLRTEELLGAYAYYDAYMDDDRLTIETHRSAFAGGAKAANYVRVTGVEYNGEKACAIKCKDQLTNKEFLVRGRHFVGTLGPWTDIFGNEVLHQWKNMLRPTKGVHITLDRNRLNLKEAVVMSDDAKNRIVFGIPRHEMIIIGTTDTDYKGDPSDVNATEEDIEYLLKVSSEYFPGAKITKNDIIASYSGVRPLVHDGSSSEGKTSREHKIWSDPRNFTFVAGGKYTTYRLMAEEVVDFALESFSVEDRVKFGKSQTKEPLNPKVSSGHFNRAKKLVSEFARHYQYSNQEVEFLIERHGMEAEELLSRGVSDRLDSVWEMEAYYAIHHTMCHSLVDFYSRRVPLFLARRDHGLPMLDKIAATFSRYLNWDDSETKNQKSQLEQYMKRELSWKK